MATPVKPAPIPEMSGAQSVDLHREEALALPAKRVRSSFDMPIRVIVDEGQDVGRYAHDFWHPEDPSVPGLERVEFRIPGTAPARLVTLASAAREMCYVVAVGTGSPSLRAAFEEGERVLGTLRRDLGFYLDDGVETEEDDQLAALGDEHDDTASIDRLADALYDYARLGQTLGPAMVSAGMKTWDPAVVDRAFALHGTLNTPLPPASRAEIDLRNRLVSLVIEDTTRIRRAAEYLWSRDHSKVQRLFASTWLRNRRLAAKRRRAAEKVVGVGDQPVA